MHIQRSSLCLVSIAVGSGCATGTIADEHAPDRYFAEGELEPQYPDIDEFTRDWFSNCLRSMAEPTLASAAPASPATCRFLYLRSFDPAICVRFERALAGVRITSTVLAFDDYPFPPEPILPAQRRELVDRELDWNELRSRLARPGIWLPRGSTEEEFFTVDGARWVLELRDGSDYRVVHRHSPTADGPYAEFRELCVALLAAAETRLSPDKVY